MAANAMEMGRWRSHRVRIVGVVLGGPTVRRLHVGNGEA